MPTSACRLAALLALSVCCAGAACHAQEIEPRAYSPAPKGVNFLVFGGANSSGGVLTDPSLPVENIEASIDALVVGYGRTFGLFGRSANAAIVFPYVFAEASGDIGEQRASVSRNGVGDTRIRMAVNLIGAPALTPREFMQHPPETTLGFSFILNVPNGKYDPSKLVNIGTNRWAAKTEFGLSHPWRAWVFETYAGAWWFDDNDNFFGGQLREQDPLLSAQAHVSYTIRPRMWVALDATFYDGGQTTLNGLEKRDRQSNSRAGVTFAMPLGRDFGLKFNWSRGATTRIGSSFTTYGIALQYVWMDKPARQ